MTVLTEKITALKQRIRVLEERYDRPRDSVKLLAVSKKQAPEKIRRAAADGIEDFGENYFQEALEKIARRLSAQRSDTKPPLNICVQVNLSAEASKSGLDLQSAASLCASIAQLPNLSLRGLMAIPAPLSDLQAQRQGFRRLASEYQKLQQHYPSMDTLSMGMSNDYEAAIAEGSTMIRLGTALFGLRSTSA